MVSYPSKLVEQAVNEIAKLPGIGKKSALRIVIHLLSKDEDKTFLLTEALANLKKHTKYCRLCFNISDYDLCGICTSEYRDQGVICVVESFPDVIAIENTAQYNGVFHVLKGIISPIKGIGPSDLTIDALLSRIKNAEGKVKEVILALSSSMEGETTAFYISKHLKKEGVKVSTIARGIPVGGEIEFTDEVTLGRSILSRISYQ